jgi:hypothetical protein
MVDNERGSGVTPERLAEKLREAAWGESVKWRADLLTEVSAALAVLEGRHEAAWADRNKIAGEYQDLILRLTVAEGRLAEATEALRFYSNELLVDHPSDRNRAAVALDRIEALRAEPATEGS